VASWGSPVERLKAGADSTGGAAGAAANSGSGGRAGSAGTGPLTAARGGLGGFTPWCMKVTLSYSSAESVWDDGSLSDPRKSQPQRPVKLATSICSFSFLLYLTLKDYS
jgi:hypothetical protein